MKIFKHYVRVSMAMSLLLLVCCGQSVGGGSGSKTDQALKFVNSYVEHLSNESDVGIREWVTASNLVTRKFKKELARILDAAYKEDPEMGLDFDPILNAQDYPEKGFVLEKVTESEWVILHGKDWPDFKIKVRMALENGKWLVDGCGIVNIPTGEK